MPNTASGATCANYSPAVAELLNELGRLDNVCDQLAEAGLSFDEIRRLPISADLVSLIVAKQSTADAEQSAVRRPTVGDLELWFDMLADLADMAVSEGPERMGNLAWAIGQLAEKFSRDVDALRGEVSHG